MFCSGGQSDLDPRTIDPHFYVNLPFEILYQYEYVAKLKRLNYGTIATCLRKYYEYQYERTKKQERGSNGNDIT